MQAYTTGSSETFGTVVREKRIALDISLREMARKLGISTTYLSHIEIDRVPPPLPDKICGFSQILDLDQARLMRLAGRVDEHAVQTIKSRPNLQALFSLAFTMDEDELDGVLKTLRAKTSQRGEKTLF